MAKPLLTDEQWERIEPLLPPVRPRRYRYPGRKPLTHSRALAGILFVLQAGISWNDLPREMNRGSGSRCRRRLAEWHEAVVVFNANRERNRATTCWRFPFGRTTTKPWLGRQSFSNHGQKTEKS